MATVSLCELLGSTVYDASGAASGRVREVALAPQEDRSRVSLLIVKTPKGNRLLPLTAVSAINSGIHASTAAGIGPLPTVPKACCCSAAICSISR